MLQKFKSFSTSKKDSLPTCLLINWPIHPSQINWTAKSIKELGYVDIIGPDWHYLNSPLRHSQDFKDIENELYEIAFMDPKRTITDVFHEVGILVHPYTAKDDFLRFSECCALDEYSFYYNDL